MPNMPYEKICLAALGADQDAVKQVDHQLRQVIKNISDVNTDVTKKRTVTLKITFNPDQDRKSADISYTVEAKLAGDKPGSDFVTIAQDGVGHVPMSEQLELTQPSLAAHEGGE